MSSTSALTSRYDLRSLRSNVTFQSSQVSIIKTEKKCWSCQKLDAFKRQKTKYVQAVRKARQYTLVLTNKYDSILMEAIRWPNVPGIDDEKEEGFNYLASLLWLLMYSIPILCEDADFMENKNLQDDLCRRIQDVCKVAEDTGMEFKGLLRHLKGLRNATGILHQAMYNRPTAHHEKSESEALQTMNEVLFESHFTIQDFKKFAVYARHTQQAQWQTLSTFDPNDKQQIVFDGLAYLTNSLGNLQQLMRPVVSTLKSCTSYHLFSRHTLLPHISQMKKSMAYLQKNSERYVKIESKVLSYASKTYDDISQLVSTGHAIVSKVWEITLVARLGYEFVKECNLPLPDYTQFLTSKFGRSVAQLVNETKFQPHQMYSTPYLQVLKKIPTVFYTTELALFPEGYVHKSKVREHSLPPLMPLPKDLSEKLQDISKGSKKSKSNKKTSK